MSYADFLGRLRIIKAILTIQRRVGLAAALGTRMVEGIGKGLPDKNNRSFVMLPLAS